MSHFIVANSIKAVPRYAKLVFRREIAIKWNAISSPDIKSKFTIVDAFRVAGAIKTAPHFPAVHSFF